MKHTTEQLQALLNAYNAYTASEFDNKPISIEELKEHNYILGLAYTQLYNDELSEDDENYEKEMQVDYDVLNEEYKYYIGDEVYTEKADIEFVTEDIASCDFQAFYSSAVDYADGWC